MAATPFFVGFYKVLKKYQNITKSCISARLKKYEKGMKQVSRGHMLHFKVWEKNENNTNRHPRDAKSMKKEWKKYTEAICSISKYEKRMKIIQISVPEVQKECKKNEKSTTSWKIMQNEGLCPPLWGVHFAYMFQGCVCCFYYFCMCFAPLEQNFVLCSFVSYFEMDHVASVYFCFICFVFFEIQDWLICS